MKPLQGKRVIEIGQYVAVPALGFMLSMLGAEVIKVEPIGGDITRRSTFWSWINYNAGKKSICIDVKKKEGREIFRKISRESDIVIEGLSPGSAKRLGIDYKEIKKINRKIIYCSIKGFGSSSKEFQRPVFDTVAQAEAGLMYVTMKEKDDIPSRVGNPCVDLTASMFGLNGILCSILSRRYPSYIEVPLIDVVLFWNSYWFPLLQLGNQELQALGSTHPGFSPYRVFKCKDGFVFIGVLSDEHWNSLCNVLGLRELVNLGREERIRRRSELEKIIQEALIKMGSREVREKLVDLVPFGLVRDLRSLLDWEEVREKLRAVSYEGKQSEIILPPLFDANKELRTPGIGENTRQILRKLGYTNKIEELYMKKVVG